MYGSSLAYLFGMGTSFCRDGGLMCHDVMAEGINIDGRGEVGGWHNGPAADAGHFRSRLRESGIGTIALTNLVTRKTLTLILTLKKKALLQFYLSSKSTSTLPHTNSIE